MIQYQGEEICRLYDVQTNEEYGFISQRKWYSLRDSAVCDILGYGGVNELCAQNVIWRQGKGKRYGGVRKDDTVKKRWSDI